jgi:hypothetical protein
MLAEGVTGFRQMSGSDKRLAERRAGTLPIGREAPAALETPGELLTPFNAGSPQAVEAAIRHQKEAGAEKQAARRCSRLSTPPEPAGHEASAAADGHAPCVTTAVTLWPCYTIRGPRARSTVARSVADGLPMNMLLPDARDLDLTRPLAELAEQGWATLGKILDDMAAESLRARADDLMLGRVQYDGLFFQRDSPTGRYEDLQVNRGWEGPGLDYRKIEKLERDPLFLAWIQNDLFARIAHALIGPQVALYRAVLMTKAATGGTELAWHQDGGRFWGLDRDPTLQIWTALDDAPVEAGCVEVLPGTHRAGLVTPNGGTVPEAALLAHDAHAKALPVPAQAGEVLLLHNHTWHRSGRNTTGRTRRAISVCYMSAETRCTRRKRAPRQFLRLFS